MLYMGSPPVRRVENRDYEDPVIIPLIPPFESYIYRMHVRLSLGVKRIFSSYYCLAEREHTSIINSE